MTLPLRYTQVGPPFGGGMSQVIPCNDSVLDRKVAIKTIRLSTSRRRVRDELAALQKIRSKHVVQVYEVLTVDADTIGIVQEYVEGRDLTVGGCASDTVDVYCKLLWQIAAGICDIHSVGVIHRDIKLNNMKVDGEQVLKIFDFGLARDAGPKAETQGFVGTHAFAAPELYDNAPCFTEAVDTYAFGITALLLGSAQMPAELRMRPPRPTGTGYFDGLTQRLPPHISESLNKCISARPHDRPPMPKVRDVLAQQLLFGRHRALVLFKGQGGYLTSSNRTVRLQHGTLGGTEIYYNDLAFVLRNVVGDVYVNNASVAAGFVLPGACVLTLGAPQFGNQRAFVTVDVSHPEVVL